MTQSHIQPNIPPAPPKPGPKDWALLGLLAFIWGGSFFVITIALRGYGPYTVGASRAFFASITLGIVALILRQPLPGVRTQDQRRVWVFILGMGVFSSAFPFVLIAWGQQYVTSAYAGVAMSCSALAMLPLAHFFAPGERMTVPKVAGFSLGLCGVIVLIGPQAFDTTGKEMEIWGRLACLMGTISIAAGSVITRRCPPVAPVPLTFAALLITGVILVPIAIAKEGLPSFQGQLPTTALIFLGTITTAFALLMRTKIIQSVGPSFMSTVNYQTPIWSVILGAAILGEEIKSTILIALVLILGGLALSQMRRNRPAD